MTDTTANRRGDADTGKDGKTGGIMSRFFGALRGKKSKGPWWRPSVTTLLGVALLVGLTALRFYDPGNFVETARVKTFDIYNQIKPRTPLERSPVYIVDIDEKSLEEIGQWPWSRVHVARLVAALRSYGAPVVGFDAVFAEPDKTSLPVIAETARGISPEALEEMKQAESNDQLLARILGTQRVVLGQAASRFDDGREVPDVAQQTSVKAFKGLLGANANSAEETMLRFPTLIYNRPELEEAATGRAFFSVDEEPDGLVRRVPMVKFIAGVKKPTLSLEMLRVAFGGNAIVGFIDPGGFQAIGLQIPGQGNYRIPVDAKGRLWVYFAKPDTYNTEDNSGRMYVSATDIINKRVPKEQLYGRLALVGTSATGLLDIRATPIEPRLPGVEVHANIIETILQEQYLKHPKEMEFAEIIFAVVSGLLMIVIVPRLGPFVALGFVVVGAAGLVWFSWFQFDTNLIFLDVTFPGGTMIALFALTAFSNYARDATEKRQVRGAFAQYLSPDLVEQLAENPDQLKLGGETKRMTLLFCDVRGFTSISELYKDDPQGLTVLINRLLTPLTDAILVTGGTIDKYMGDCIMAFWNAPLDVPNQETSACKAALDMFDSLHALNVVRKKEAEEEGMKFLPLNIGIGINTGDVVVGNMGSAQRFDYSVLGDAVNLAARLEGQSKSYGVGNVIGEVTNDVAKDTFPTLQLDNIAVKGKAEAVRIYTILGRPDLRDTAEFKDLAERHAAFQDAYLAQKWDKAQEIAKENRGKMGGVMDAFYDIFDERINEFRENPPPQPWDGVYVATSK
ncbi:MAG: adenylate/guanylate cyclase domain-containing protein [Alphaproteobacteria bacterium]